MMTPCGTATSALIAHLRSGLDSAVDAVNAERSNVIMAPLVGPYVIPAGGGYLGLAADPSLPEHAGWYFFDEGIVSAADVVIALGGMADWGIEYDAVSDASDGARLGLSSLHLSSSRRPLVIMPGLHPDITSSVNLASVFGWAGGETSDIEPVIAPSDAGVCDGFPVAVPDMGQGFWVIVGDREATPHGGSSSLRVDAWDVRIQLHIARPSLASDRHRTREPISACLAAVSSCLLSTSGRQLGRASVGDIGLVEVQGESVGGRSIAFEELRNVLFDTATLDIVVRVFLRPSAS